MDKGKSAMPLLAIVAIVAVVAVVMVALQGRTPSSEEAVAGEAVRSLSSGDYVSLKKMNQASILSFNENPNLLSCDQICSNAGKTCIDAYLDIEYATGDRDGTTLHQWVPRMCNEGSASNPVRCHCY